MANSYILYNGNGATTDFTVPFGYFDVAHVTLEVSGSSAPFAWISPTLIRATTAPVAGTANVKVKRSTPKTRMVDFTDGAGLTADDLNTQAIQAQYIAEEQEDAYLLGGLTNLSVATSNLQASSVTTAKIADLSVTTAKINDLAVTTAKLADSAVTAAKILSGVIDQTKFDSSVMYQVDTIASLKALVGGSHISVFVRGYYSEGDGGGGSFYWDAASALTDDAGSAIQPNAGGTGRWRRVRQSAIGIPVRWFGAKGDNLTDDSTAINNTLAYARTLGKPGSLNQVGGTALFDKGRFLIKATISMVEGDALIGEQSGLDSSPTASASTGTSIVVSTTLSGGGAWNNSVCITVTGGGPITVKDIGFNGTQTVTNSTWLKSGDGVTNIGITQGHFKGLRIVGFTAGVLAFKFFDVDFNDVGFESNELDFDIRGTGAYDSFYDVRFANCTFFNPGTAHFQMYAGATPERVSFAGCTFFQGTVSAAKFGLIVYDASIKDWQFSSCTIYQSTSNAFLRCLDATSAIDGFELSACSFKSGSLLAIPAVPAAASMKGISVNGCKFNNCLCSLDTVSKGLRIVGNTFEGASTLTINVGQDSVIVGNDFGQCTGSVLALTGIHTGLLVAANNFPSSYTTLGINASSTNVVTGLNIGVNDFAAGSATYDPPSLADGVGTTTTVTASGAVLGDFAEASFSLDLQGITLSAYVSAANTVSVRFQNESGGVLDLASGTLRVRVIRKQQ